MRVSAGSGDHIVSPSTLSRRIISLPGSIPPISVAIVHVLVHFRLCIFRSVLRPRGLSCPLIIFAPYKHLHPTESAGNHGQRYGLGAVLKSCGYWPDRQSRCITNFTDPKRLITRHTFPHVSSHIYVAMDG